MLNYAAKRATEFLGMDKPTAVRALSLALAIEAGLALTILAAHLAIGGWFYVPSVIAFLVAMPVAGVLCGRAGRRLSGMSAFGLSALVYLVSVPVFVWIDRVEVPQDGSVLAVAMLLLAFIFVPLATLGVAVLNTTALPAKCRR